MTLANEKGALLKQLDQLRKEEEVRMKAMADLEE
eukprot:CAMPEP_0170512538 /NCGR_PEP_ID=MMETSP0208-20121228/66905_1 /TAXON_ID=197538 /ORGANISM="Strombidium inclinatum, Strain S3" /LENGTH=33 /DNA_ID= /DNA_START= /DNA_END= /DNA_ORIENTATION=